MIKIINIIDATDIFALALTFVIYMLLAIAYYGWGRFTTKFLFYNEKDTLITTNIWIGWAVSLLIFQTVHLVAPLDIFIVLPIFIIGMIVTFRYSLRKRDGLNKNFFNLQGKKKFLLAIPVILAVPVILWIASHSMLGITNYDSGLYHLNMIKWTNSYSIIPGLGNLHGRFAFNQSFFTYVSALNFFPYFNHGRSLANSFLLILSLATMIEVLYTGVKRPSFIDDMHPFKYVPALFILPILVHLALTSNGLASPSPDLTSTLLQLLMFVFLAKSIGEWMEGNLEQNNNAIFLSILAATAITIKLSNLAFSAIIFTILLVYLIYTKQLKTRITFYIMLLPSIIIIIFMLRGIIISGVPLYPSTIGYALIPMEWSMSKEAIINEANWVYSWARKPGANPSEVLGNWKWFEPWIRNIFRFSFMGVIYPLLLTILFLSITFILIILKKVKKLQLVEIIVIFPVIASFLFWFFTAPDLRFVNGVISLLVLSSFMLFLASIKKDINIKTLFTILVLVFLSNNINHFIYIKNNPNCLKKVSLGGWVSDKKVPLSEKVTKTGLKVYSPLHGDQCWDSELPCTPYFNNLLKLRVDGKLMSGFIIDKKIISEKK